MCRIVQCSVLHKNSWCVQLQHNLCIEHWIGVQRTLLGRLFVLSNFVSCDTHEFSLGCDKRRSIFCSNKTFPIRYFCKNAPTWQSANSVLKFEHLFLRQRFYFAYTDTQEFCLQSFSTEQNISHNIFCIYRADYLIWTSATTFSKTCTNFHCFCCWCEF